MRAFLDRHVVQPLIGLLRMGATPEGLAWAIAVGMALGVNPLLGSTTLLGLAVAAIFRMNLVATQIGNHIVYPVQIALFPLWVSLGVRLFHTAGLPWDRKRLLFQVSHHPWQTTRVLWTWEWHALVVWAVAAVVAAPLLQLLLKPLLHRLQHRFCHGTVAGQNQASAE